MVTTLALINVHRQGNLMWQISMEQLTLRLSEKSNSWCIENSSKLSGSRAVDEVIVSILEILVLGIPYPETAILDNVSTN